MNTAEKYLRPEVIRQVARLDLRAKFIVEGFLSGLHASPFQGFSVEFSEHRKYVPGDDLKDLDWNDYANCLAAALGYLMIHQQDPVGLVTFDTRIQTSLPPRSKRTQLGKILSVLANLKPAGETA